MSAETVPRLPAIKSVHVAHGSTQQEQEQLENEPEKKEERLHKATSYIARVRLGSVHKQPRPGDVYRPRTSAGPGRFSTARPLGLIPDRGERMNLLKELSRFFTPVSGPPGPSTAPVLPNISLPEVSSESAEMMTIEEEGKLNNELSHPSGNSPISTTFKFSENKSQNKSDLKKQEPVNGRLSGAKMAGPPISSILRTESPSPYRLHQCGAEKPRHVDSRTVFENDPDYIELLANCNIKDYYGDMSEKTQGVHRVPQSNGTLGVDYSRRRFHTLPATGSQWNGSPRMTKLALSKKTARRSHTVEYFNFSGQAKLWNRNLTDDRRDALDYIPCERCRLRGGRCARCKAIRTGGGYIILDEDDLSDDDLQRKFANRFGFGDDEYCYGHGADDGVGRSRQRTDQDGAASRYRGGDGSLSEVDGDSGRQYGDGSGGLGRRRRGTGDLGGGAGTGGHGEGEGGGGNWRLGRDQANKTGLGDDNDMLGRNRDKQGDDGLDGDKTATDRGIGGDEDGSLSGLHSDASGRLGSRQSGSRPASTLDSRPASSMKKVGVRGSARNRKRNFGVEKKQRGRGQGEEGESGGSDGEGRSRRRKGHGGDSDDDGEGRERADYKFGSSRREGEDGDEETARSYADLMRFKKKRDEVKALHATMKELQGIDPLDYLAKYCIIDQAKLPHYQHAYDNVDRDEDDEIDIAELDFALKAVNYDLISDAEMSYVHSILELAGRYKLNFRLFSLIAALSEKVVALEDMVKRLINKMDFEALEVKMKKCKELFYLLADTESSGNEGGVVTTTSLAVELQAGGLTEEHVEFVVDRLNHEDKGIVEFLDYLTYVPLFVEIHDTISGNPLDFSRTK